MSLPPPVARLRLAGISKTYDAVVANDGVDLVVMPGEIHAVLGENGAGKSTLMKIICGVVRPDSGTVWWNGEEVTIASPSVARALGIGMVFQHFSLFDTLTVAENIALALDQASVGTALNARIREVSGRYGLPLDPQRHVHTLSVGERQRVEIVRSLLQSPALLILDEPTSVLTPAAIDSLFETLKRVADEGCAIVYVSHKLGEIRSLCQRATVLRDGRVVGVCDPRQESEASLARMMIGGDLPHARHRTVTTRGDGKLLVRGLTLKADEPFGVDLVDIDLDVSGGEIVGIAGIAGNGQEELLAALSGERTVDADDTIVLNGIASGTLGAATRRALGVAYVPEDRLGRGAVTNMSLADNALLTAHRKQLSWVFGFVRRSAVRAYARAAVAKFHIKGAGPDTIAGSLSGGNLQRFIVGREILQGPRVMIAAQPTWGVDIAASVQIRQALIDLRDQGVAVLLVSEELDELMELCDRIAVIARGHLSVPVHTRDTNAESLGLLMGGAFIEPERRPSFAGPATGPKL